MLGKLRRSSKSHESKQQSSVPSRFVPERVTTRSERRCLTFFSLPAETRNVVYEHIALNTHIRILSRKEKSRYNGLPPIPSLFIASRQTRHESLPLLLTLAHVRVVVREFDFKPLICVVRSLYRTEMKSLRQNENLTIQLLGEKCRKESLVPLRIWLEDRGKGLDRLPWRYTVLWTPTQQVLRTSAPVSMANVLITRKKVLHQNLEALGQMLRKIEEMTQFELSRVIDAFETELFDIGPLPSA